MACFSMDGANNKTKNVIVVEGVGISGMFLQ